ncbi:MAG: tryptophan--tRNA ligase [Omnitrophica bacterium RIFCSPHIGHO2_02_FULL_46_11]|nr:MAG: tryptophan--tRNA ligase [Omnitrophica bacterium RIFCSPHIGHO2_02_FULL_46_11]OGW87260.1 MAG: tryptophan--tRNA ligase [Omnitrophica bacterium RIFCSPLOWO2_01_FULL_45_10b]
MPKRILSGMRPTAKLHLGNLLGALENWKKFEGEDSFFMIADWHALTTEYASHTAIKANVIEVVIDYLAAGLDPNRSTIFLQSLVPEHAELSLLLSMITPLSWLERNPTYKDQIAEQKGKDLMTHGFLGYPVLQAADILLYQADAVPVGEDQLPHLELAREIARRFNHLYRKVFKEAEAILTKTPKIPGLDGRKMSKSYGNTIDLSDSPEEVDKKVMQMVTDPARKRREDKGHPEVCPVYFFHTIFNKDNEKTVAKECRAAERGCVECKHEMANHLTPFLKPIYERRREIAARRDHVRDVLIEGSKKAKAVAAKTLAEAKDAAGIGI